MVLERIPTVAEFGAFFTGEYEATAAEIERTEQIPPRLLEAAAHLGAYRLTIPKQYGGWELDILDYLPYLEGAAMGPGSGRMLVHVTNGIWRPLERFGTSEQRALIAGLASGQVVIAFCLTERTGGTGRDVHSRAERRGDRWLLSGEKHLITFADRADYFLLLAATGNRSDPDPLTAFLIPRETPGFGIDLSQPTMGLHGTGHGILTYEGMEVDDRHRLGAVGEGMEVVRAFLEYSRVSLSNCMVGTAQRALDESAAFARRRVTFGRPIAERQAVQVHLADMHTDVAAGRGLVREAAARCQAGLPFGVEAATAKLFCLNMAGRVTDLALRVHGGYGYTKESAIERLYRDARGYWFEEGTAEIQQLLIARHVLAS